MTTAFAINATPKVYAKTLAGGSTYNGSNSITFSNATTVCLINNLSNSNCHCRLNADSNATFTLMANSSITFERGDLSITSVDFDNSPSGSSAVNVEVLVGLAQ